MMASEPISKVDAATSPTPQTADNSSDGAVAVAASSSASSQSTPPEAVDQSAAEIDSTADQQPKEKDGAATSRDSFITRLATSFKHAWGVKAVSRCFSCCSAASPSSVGNSAKSDAAAVTSTHQFSGLWYAPLLACCPCMNRCCCCSGLRVLSSDVSSGGSSSEGGNHTAYRFLGEGGAPAPITADEDQNATGSVEMTELPGESSHDHKSSIISSSKQTPAKEPKHPGLTLLAPLPLLPSSPVSQSLSPIAAPDHQVVNAQILGQPKPVEKAPELLFTHHQIEANDAMLLVPLHSQHSLEAELSAFYSDLTGTQPVQSDDALSGDDIDDELDLLSSDSDELDLDDSDDPLGIVKSNQSKDPKRLAAAQRAKARALEETPAARRKREQQIAEKKKQIAEEKERAEAQRLEEQRRAQIAAAEQARAAAAREAEIRERDRLRERDRERQRIKMEEAQRKAEAERKAVEEAQAAAAAKVAEAEAKAAAIVAEESAVVAKATEAAAETQAAPEASTETELPVNHDEALAAPTAATELSETIAESENPTEPTTASDMPAASEETESSHSTIDDTPSTPAAAPAPLDEEFVEEPVEQPIQPVVEEESAKEVPSHPTVVEPKENEAPVEKTDNVPRSSSVADDDDDGIDADALVAELENLSQ